MSRPDCSVSTALAEKIEDLDRDGDVEPAGRLVDHQQPGRVGDRQRQDHPLAHAARQLVRVGLEPALGIGDADGAQQIHGLDQGLGGTDPVMRTLGIGDLPADRQDRVEVLARVGESEPEVLAPDLP